MIEVEAEMGKIKSVQELPTAEADTQYGENGSKLHRRQSGTESLMVPTSITYDICQERTLVTLLSYSMSDGKPILTTFKLAKVTTEKDKPLSTEALLDIHLGSVSLSQLESQSAGIFTGSITKSGSSSQCWSYVWGPLGHDIPFEGFEVKSSSDRGRFLATFDHGTVSHLNMFFIRQLSSVNCH